MSTDIGKKRGGLEGKVRKGKVGVCAKGLKGKKIKTCCDFTGRFGGEEEWRTYGPWNS